MDPSPTSPHWEDCSFGDLSRTQLIFALMSIVLTLLTATMNQAISIAAMPRAIAALNGFARYSWPTTSFLLTSTIAMPVSAKLSDLYGRKWFYWWSSVAFVVSLLLCGTAGHLPLPLDGMNQLVVAYGFLGLGNGAITALSFTLVADLFPPSERGRYQGFLAGVYGVAFIAGPGLGGWVTDHLSWRWAYYADAPLGSIAVLVVYLTLPDVRPHMARRAIDWAGIVTLCGWLVPLLLALTWVGQTGWSAGLIQALLIAFVALLATFLLIEKRAAEPLLVLSLFSDRRIALMSVNFFLLGISLFGVAVYLPLFLQGVLGASAARSGLVFSQYTLSILAGNLVGGQLLSRTGRYRLLAIVGAGLATAGLLLLYRMDGSTTQFELVCNAVICGLGFGALSPTYEVLVQNAAPRALMGVATGSTRFFNTIGGAIGLALFGATLLKLYHQHFDILIPVGTPAALTRTFDNPLQLVFTRPHLEPAFLQLTNGQALLATLLHGVRLGLIAGLHAIFLCATGIMAVSLFLNLFLSDAPPQKNS